MRHRRRNGGDMCGGWPLDDHFPLGFYHNRVANTNFPTPAPYTLPYRALYSKNVENLFFAGRNISMTHMAMSSIRVMATCALLGQAVGTAAFYRIRKGIFQRHAQKTRLIKIFATAKTDRTESTIPMYAEKKSKTERACAIIRTAAGLKRCTLFLTVILTAKS